MFGFEWPSLIFLDCSVLLQILRICVHDLLSLIAINCDVLFFFFWQKNIKMFLCVAYGQYPNIFWISSFKKKQIFEVSKLCFRMDFLNTTKNLFLLHFWILQHVCKTPKGIGQYSKKIQKSYFLGGSHLLFTVNVWIKKPQRDEYLKYYWE